MTKNKKETKKTRAKKHMQVEFVSIMGLRTYISPIALHTYAKDFLRVAKIIPPDRVPFTPARFYLVCHAIELSLKSFLSARKATLQSLSAPSLGHNLSVLLEEAIAGGLQSVVSLRSSELKIIEQASEYYAEKVFEYPAIFEAIRGMPKLPDWHSLLNIASSLVDDLEQTCLNAS